MSKDAMSEHEFYELLQHLPRPGYPYPDLVNPFIEQLREECNRWIDTDYTFHSEAAREKHKRHRFTDIPARGFPFIKAFEEMLPISRYSAHGSMMDDYFDHCSRNEMYEVRERIMALLRGEDKKEPRDLGIYRQFYLLRQDAIRCGMPQHLYDKFIYEINSLMVGYQDEKRYIAANEPPPLPVFLVIREDSSGGQPFCKYLCMQKDFRKMPDTVLEHPAILRLHSLASRLIGFHNDIISLPKELARKGDVVNLVMVMRHEYKVSLEEAYMMAMDFHDNDLKEFMTLHKNLPDLGEWQEIAYDYVQTMGIMIQGVYSWHTTNTLRYIPNACVEPEYLSPEWKWQSKKNAQ